jgi:hypothetical protein
MSTRISRRLLLAGAAPAWAALRPGTLQAYQEYIQKTETRARSQNSSPTAFLWSTTIPMGHSRVVGGEILTEKLGSPPVPDGLVQHWIAAAFFPKASLETVLRVDQDYNRYKDMYAPDIIASKLLGQQGNRFDIYYRLKKKKIVSAIMDTKHQVDFNGLSKARHAIESRSTEVREVVDAGTPREKVLGVGEGQGFLYAMNSYWRMEQADGGVHVECEAITLARSLPFGLRAMIGPFIEGFAVDSLKSTLEAKRRAVETVTRAGR